MRVEGIVPKGPGSSAVSGSVWATELLERSHELSALAAWLGAVADGSPGRLVLVGGEAGVGKTVLLRRFCDDNRGSARILWGACEPLFTPRPLGPFLDVAELTGGEFGRLVESSPTPFALVSALMHELAGRTTVLVLEDVHWGDEATLDVLRLLGRRIEATSTLVLASYRDDELERDHPLRIVLGELATHAASERLKLEPLSSAAVAKLAEPGGVDAPKLQRATGGNPFFVTEVIAAGGEQIPTTVQDAVIARAARLSAPARELLDVVAIVPPKAELWLLEALAGDLSDSLEDCLGSGMLTAEPGGVAFRHELARLALEETLTAPRRLALHRKALAALARPPAGAADPARLAHHAEAAGDAEAVLRHAPGAAARAAKLGAHREAAAQYARALRFAGDAFPATDRAELLEARAYECYLSDQLDEAIQAQERGLACRREVGDRRSEGDSLRSLARLLGFVGRTQEAAEACREAVALLEQLEPGRELAMAYGKLSQRCVNWEDVEGAIDWGMRAVELAQQLDDTEILVYALTSVGAAEFRTRRSQGQEKLERSLELAQAAGLEDHVGRAYTNLVWLATRERSFDLANRHLEAGLQYCDERGLDYWGLSLLGCRARLELDQGHWTEAADAAAVLLRDRHSAPVPRVLARVVLGLVRARRGEPDVWPLLDAALGQAEPTGELQQIGPAAAAWAEAAWLEGRPREAGEATRAPFELARGCPARWELGELASWRWRAGIDDGLAPGAAEPYALQIAGEWARAAELWAGLGCPYEAALALGDSDDEDAQRRALSELQELGAAPAAAIVARRLRKRGARGLPRGPRASTRRNPANLTSRELEVLELVAQGLRNAQIAERLFLSEKTVAHHVSAILRKLDVSTRGEATAEAARLGLASQDR
jgi:DNA-binding CsgD family transcriptional regulator/tetratricopeptide (TPR) repeat protein